MVEILYPDYNQEQVQQMRAQREIQRNQEIIKRMKLQEKVKKLQKQLNFCEIQNAKIHSALTKKNEKLQFDLQASKMQISRFKKQNENLQSQLKNQKYLIKQLQNKKSKLIDQLKSKKDEFLLAKQKNKGLRKMNYQLTEKINNFEILSQFQRKNFFQRENQFQTTQRINEKMSHLKQINQQILKLKNNQIDKQKIKQPKFVTNLCDIYFQQGPNLSTLESQKIRKSSNSEKNKQKKLSKALLNSKTLRKSKNELLNSSHLKELNMNKKAQKKQKTKVKISHFQTCKI